MKDPDFDIAFSLGRFHVYWYAILLAFGIGAAVMIADRRAKGRNVQKDIALDLCILGVPFGIIGARLFACLSGEVSWSHFFDLTQYGLSFFGGILFAALAILVYLNLRNVSVEEMLDIAAPGTFAGIGISVWGDFFNRKHYGPLVEKASHKWFPLATFGDDLRIHYAAFFYEFLLCVILIVLYYVVLRKLIRRGSDRFLVMSLVYCLGRFCIDGIREDSMMVGPIAFDQICEIVLSVVCLLLLFLRRSTKATDGAKNDLLTNGEEETEQEPTVSGAMKDAAKETKPAETEAKDSFTGLN